MSSAQAGMIDKEGMQEWEICAMCHSLDGISRMAKFPKLAGQKPEYISKQFFDFNTAIRTNDGGQMEAITTEVDAASVEQIANYFASLPAPPAEPLESDEIVLEQYRAGEKLFNFGGEPSLKSGSEEVPACASCHAQSESAVPWLYGQHSDYLVKQLMDFKSGERSNDDVNGMSQVASSLSDSDMQALAIYLSSTQPRIVQNEE